MFKLFKPFPLFIGVRYTNLKRRDTFITFISLISMIGIALSVMVLIAVLSVMNGFSKEIRSKILSVTPHLTTSGFFDEKITDWKTLTQKINQHPEVQASYPYVEGQGMLMYDNQLRGVMVRGILPEQNNAVFGDMSALKAGTFGVFIGRQLAEQFDVKVGDTLTLIVPEMTISLAGVAPRLKRLKVAGIFEVGFGLDSGLIFLNLSDAAKLFKMGESISGIQSKLQDPFNSNQVRIQLKEALHNEYHLVDWTMMNSTYFSAVKMEKTMMFFTLMLILAIAVFNLISTLVMIVTDKQSDIAILRTLGASRGHVMGIFMWQGIIIGVIGTFMGIVAGVLLALNVTRLVDAIQHFFGVQLLAEDVYFLSYLPSQLLLEDVVLIGSVSLILSLLATLHPAWRASNILPAEALRYDK